MKLAADANVLLAAIAGGRTKLVLDHPRVEEVFTASPVLDEVCEYVRELAAQKQLPEDLLLITLTSLPVTVVERKAASSKSDDHKGMSPVRARQRSHRRRLIVTAIRG